MPNEAKNSKSKDPKFWYELAVENFLVQGKSKRTAETYAREICILAAHYKKPELERFIDPDAWEQSWNINSQYIPGGGKGALKYLAPYVFRVGISNSRIVSVENRQVTFRYKKTKSVRWRTMTLDVFEFIRRFLQHVLPSGFMKVRYYGFMGSGFRMQYPHSRNSNSC